ncbi:FAD binding domain-containing protein [Oceanispirochaeta sp.]|jgi:CO/xanthine dehydrogenase FAD-binding subunit|uniref:FAD binding domain-containing protein n=1 Tax=Oceanispirochaeta sp. TaxID=2035350 RepID=UPI00260E8F5E|nr:FAD binding domain-containing protein [Oceanispirochaeta sp.]MDA3956434.1 FAD binding domain-containing protein [Oceanispirochaeta sp.]
MMENRPFHVHVPSNMTELLNLYNKAPSSLLMAGATHLMNHTFCKEAEHYNILSISQLDELKKISRTERYADLGSCVSINTMIESSVILSSSLLKETLHQMGPNPIRNAATIGGNLCIPDRRMDLFPVLLLLDARLELRHIIRKKNGRASYKSRWIHINTFLSADGKPALGVGEILTRIRIPYYDGGFHFHRKVNIKDNDFFTINALASLEKGILSDIRLAFTNGGLNVLRSRDLEANLLGRRFPLVRKDLNEIMQNLNQYFKTSDNLYEDYLVKSLFRQLLESLADPSDILQNFG